MISATVSVTRPTWTGVDDGVAVGVQGPDTVIAVGAEQRGARDGQARRSALAMVMVTSADIPAWRSAGRLVERDGDGKRHDADPLSLVVDRGDGGDGAGQVGVDGAIEMAAGLADLDVGEVALDDVGRRPGTSVASMTTAAPAGASKPADTLTSVTTPSTGAVERGAGHWAFRSSTFAWAVGDLRSRALYRPILALPDLGRDVGVLGIIEVVLGASEADLRRAQVVASRRPARAPGPRCRRWPGGRRRRPCRRPWRSRR